MRLIFTLFAVVCITKLSAQELRLLKKVRGQVELSEVVQVDSFTAAKLYFNAKLFLAEAFQGVRETSQIKDDKVKFVATKGSFPVFVAKENGDELAAKVVFKLMIQCKDNMYKYTFNEFYLATTAYTGVTLYASFNDRLGVTLTPQQWQQVEQQAEEFFDDFASDLKIQMAQTDIPFEEVVVTHKKRKSSRDK